MTSEGDDCTVLVTGASGFIATHVVQQLQQADYRVRGTVRSTQHQDKVRALRELCPGAKYPVELVEADLAREDGWKAAVAGCTYVIHVASPVPDKDVDEAEVDGVESFDQFQNPTDEAEVIEPAVEGTLRVLRACRDVGGVQRVVITSSGDAITPGHTSGNFSEADWTDVTSTKLAYVKSKTLAEKAAWDFVNELPEGQRLELVTIQPTFVVGPVLCGGRAAVMEIPKQLLERKIPLLPRVRFGMIDVRDVAAAHVAAMRVPDAAGKRFIVTAEDLWTREVALVLKREFGPLGYKVPTKEAPLFVVKVLSKFDKALEIILPLWGKTVNYDNSQMLSVLKIQPRPVSEALVEMSHSMIRQGFAKKTKKYQKTITT